jgi:hypothetical protein
MAEKFIVDPKDAKENMTIAVYFHANQEIIPIIGKYTLLY